MAEAKNEPLETPNYDALPPDQQNIIDATINYTHETGLQHSSITPLTEEMMNGKRETLAAAFTDPERSNIKEQLVNAYHCRDGRVTDCKDIQHDEVAETAGHGLPASAEHNDDRQR